jgi:hypothetical protein
MKNILIIAGFVIIAYSAAFATSISGDISGVLLSENSPYEVVGDLRVPQGLSLEIEAGCYLDFQGYYHLEVDTNALLRIQGNQSDSVIFTTQDTIVCWEGINFLYGNDGSELNFCIIERAQDPENPGDNPETFYGAVYINNSNINFSNCSVRFNKIYPTSDYSKGGGIYCKNSTLTLTDCVIADNLSYEGFGGGIYANSSVLAVNNCQILNNRASFSGSGIFCDNSISVLTGNLISGNKTYYGLGGEDSGAILIYGGETLIEDNEIVNNLSGESGGGIRLFDHVSATLNNNYIADNIAYTVAGGLNVGLCPNLILTNNIIANNQTYFDVAGGIAIWRCENMIFSNNTIYGNSAGTRGGGVAINNDSSTTFVNNIFYNNYAYEDQQIYSVNSNLTVQYSCIEGGWPGEGNIDADPLFEDAANGDFHLSWGNYPIDDYSKSPCIDAGAPWLPYDPDSTRADMGALYFDQWLNDIDEQDQLPRHVRLHQNYPNPFNARTQINYALHRTGQVSVDIYDILGRKVQTLYNGEQAAGEHSLIWKADEVASGVYFYKLTAGDYAETKRMMLVK